MANILVCDDDKEIVDAIEIYLLQEGYTIFKAYDGEQAIRVLKEQQIHLLLIDVMMPKLDGIHATLKIREYSSIPIIILSAKSEDNDKILGLNIGADDYVTKPFNPLELLARVKSNLRRYTTLGNLNAEGFDVIDRRRRESGFLENSCNHTESCKKCPYFGICRGGCRRHRQQPGTEPGENCFCESYRMFFAACLPRMQEIARLCMQQKQGVSGKR